MPLVTRQLARDFTGEEAACPQLSRMLSAIGAALASWARLDEPLGHADGAMDAIHFARLHRTPCMRGRTVAFS